VVFAAAGTHLLARLASGDLVAFTLAPRDGRAAAPLARFSVPKGEEVVAAGWRKGRMYVATVKEQGGLLHIGRGRRWRRSSAGHAWGGRAPLPRPSRLQLWPLMVDGRSGEYWYCDAGWRLHQGSLSNPSLFTAPEVVLVCGWSREGLASVGRV